MCLQPDSVKRCSPHCCSEDIILVSLLHTRNRLFYAPPEPPGIFMRILPGHNRAQTQRQRRPRHTAAVDPPTQTRYSPDAYLVTAASSPPNTAYASLGRRSQLQPQQGNQTQAQYQLQDDSLACMGSPARMCPYWDTDDNRKFP